MKLNVDKIEKLATSLMEIENEKFKLSLSIKLMQITKEVHSVYELLRQERIEIIKKYGHKDSDGELIIDEDGTVTFDPSDREKLTDELTEFYDTEVEFQIPLINMNDLEDIEISTKVLEGLYPIIEIPE